MFASTTPSFSHRENQKLNQTIGKKAKVLSFTRIFSKSYGVINRVPFYVALVEFIESKKKIMIEVVRENDEKLKIGGLIECVMRKHKENNEKLISYSMKGKVVLNIN